MNMLINHVIISSRAYFQQEGEWNDRDVFWQWYFNTWPHLKGSYGSGPSACTSSTEWVPLVIQLLSPYSSSSPPHRPNRLLSPTPQKTPAPPPPTAADHGAFHTKDLLVISDSIVVLKHDQVSSTATSFLSNPF